LLAIPALAAVSSAKDMPLLAQLQGPDSIGKKIPGENTDQNPDENPDKLPVKKLQ